MSTVDQDALVRVLSGEPEPIYPAGITPEELEYLRKLHDWIKRLMSRFAMDGLAVLVGGGDVGKVLVSSNDTLAGYLLAKVVDDGGNIAVAEVNDGGDEDLKVSHTFPVAGGSGDVTFASGDAWFVLDQSMSVPFDDNGHIYSAGPQNTVGTHGAPQGADATRQVTIVGGDHMTITDDDVLTFDTKGHRVNGTLTVTVNHDAVGLIDSGIIIVNGDALKLDAFGHVVEIRSPGEQ